MASDKLKNPLKGFKCVDLFAVVADKTFLMALIKLAVSIVLSASDKLSNIGFRKMFKGDFFFNSTTVVCAGCIKRQTHLEKNHNRKRIILHDIYKNEVMKLLCHPLGWVHGYLLGTRIEPRYLVNKNL